MDENYSYEAVDGLSTIAASANRPSTAIPSSFRHSTDEYYHQMRTPVTQSSTESPPSYDEFPFSHSLRRKFNIQPREDEGRETLPAYSTAISLQNVFMKKMELEDAVHKAQDRNWYRVLVTLQGTALTFHKCKSPNIFGSTLLGNKHEPDLPAGTTRGVFLRSYNLQHADVGIAADYIKRKYVIRVRAEADQFLLSCHKIETFVLWLQSLFAAIDLAPPLDDREIPQDLSIPRRIRRRNRNRQAGCVNIERNAHLIREQEEIMRRHFPRLAGSDREDEDEEEGDEEEEEGEASDEMTVQMDRESNPSVASSLSITASPSPSTTPRSRTRGPLSSPSHSSILASSSSSPSTPAFYTPHTNHLLGNLSRRPHANSPSSSTSQASSSRASAAQPNPSIAADGKWAPQHHWTHFYDMMYAKRCMAILTHRSPRKSNLVIMKGKRWVIDWGTGKLELDMGEPPRYGDVVGGSGNGKQIMSVRSSEVVTR